MIVFEVWMISSKYLAATRESHCAGQGVLNTWSHLNLSKVKFTIWFVNYFLFEENLTFFNASITVTPKTVYCFFFFKFKQLTFSYVCF